ncbi:hypothetical protein EON63_04820 [archaeon]|nr:MAG: hypothetical protein EON63_04820 [archaeon]
MKMLYQRHISTPPYLPYAGVFIQLDDLPVEESKGIFGGLFGGNKKVDVDQGAEGAGAWTKSTMLYPAKSHMPGECMEFGV